jgi:Acetyltransferase (GNAT) domain
VADRWRDCLQHGDFPTHYTSPEYFREPAPPGQRPFAVLAQERGEVVGVLTGTQTDRELTCGLPTRPQICLRHGRDSGAIVQALANRLLAEHKSASLITLCTWMPIETLSTCGFRGAQADALVTLDLTRGPDALFRKFSSNRRLNIKKAIRAGVEVVQGVTDDDFAQYYEIHRAWCHHKGDGRAPRFEDVLALLRLTGNRRLFLARFDGRPIAGIIVRFVPGGVVEYVATGWLKDSVAVRPSDLLHWRAIEWACASGFRIYNLAASHLYLRKFGGEIRPTYRYRVDRTFLRRHELNAAAVAHARAVFRRLPDVVRTRVRRLLPEVVMIDGLVESLRILL